ncbi:MAG: TonB-dependent receptor [Prevotella sp.]|nr:TonB-dependent receptor [Prevotella sp.]
MMKQAKIRIPIRILALFMGLFLSMGAFAQQITVQGHVVDASGEPVIGATVRVAGTSTGAMTDFDGNFTLNANQGATLEVSYIGYQTVTVSAAPDVVITMHEDAEMLNEVVVIGYGAVKKSDLTGAVTALKPDAKNKGVVVNPQDMIAGKIAGVSVISNDGTPGGGSQIRIRGGSSLNASNDPLIVIDGMIMDNNGVKGLSNPLAMVNPQDIESFNVLKDASATAIYGSRGSNGVIIITTKKGHAGQKPTVSYAGSVTLSMKNKTLDVMDGDQYRQFIANIAGTDSKAYSALGTANTDWQDLIYQNALSHDHNLTVSGSTSFLPYRLSVGFTDQEGILKTSDFQRVTAALNLSPSFFDNHLTMNLNAKGMYAKTQYADGEAVGSAFRMDPTQDPYSYTSQYHRDYFGADLDRTLQNFGGYFEWPTGGAYPGETAWPYTWNNLATKNPIAILNERSEIAHSRSFIGSADFDYKIHGFEDLRLHLTLALDLSKGRQHRDATPASPQFIYYGSHGSEVITKRNTQLSAYAQYYKDFDEKHHFDIMGGYEYSRYWRSSHSDFIGYYAPTNTLYPGQENDHTPYSFRTENILVSFFGRANYTLMDRYIFTATVRHDGSSRFKDHWSTFPSFAFAWKISDENKWRDLTWLSDLKLRLGWGMTGQQDFSSDYGYIPTYSISQGVGSEYNLVGDGVRYRPNNRDLVTWETTTTYNIGFDYGFWNNRLTGSIDWYYRKTTDLLNYAPLPPFYGFRNQGWQNIGSLRNTGVELSVDWKAVQVKDFFWNINYNFTYNNNKVLALSGSGDAVPTGPTIGTDKRLMYHQVGLPISSFWVYQQVYDQNGKAIENMVVDRDGNGVITDEDRYFYKSPAAPILMGLASRMEYKNWDLGFSLRANIGNYLFNNIESGQANVNKNEVWSSSNYMANRPVWVVEDNWQTYNLTALLSDRYVHNASFLKMDNVTLGYSFADLFGNGSWRGISGRVYATCNNVFTWTKYDGLDPEVASGYDNEMYPRPISFIFGLNLNF